MRPNSRQKIVIIGCGNVAWHIAKKLSTFKNITLEVYNHGVNKHLEEFWQQFKCKTTVGLNHIADDADVYFICVSDSAIAETARQIQPKNPGALLLHTSGSAELDELGQRVHVTGVFYPVQSFSRNDEVNWKEVPILVETNESQSINEIKQLAKLFSAEVQAVTYNERLKVHLAAVMVNNFVNGLYVAATDLLNTTPGKKAAKGFELLAPLIRKTTLKALDMHPAKAQTGPAKRKDKNVIKKHLHILSKDKQLYKVYKGLTKLIQEQQNKHVKLQGKTK